MPDNVNTAAPAETPQGATPNEGNFFKVVNTGRPAEQTTTTSEPTVANVGVATPDPFEDYRKTLGQKVGLDLKSDDEIIERLSKLTAYEQELETYKNRNPYEGLDPLAVDLDKATKAGIDINLYWEARQMDPDKLEAKEVLRREYLLKNTVPGIDQSLLSRKFEKDFNSKFGIIDKKMDEVELESSAELVQAAKDDLALETMLAKRYLQDWKQKNITIPSPAQSGPSPEEIASLRGEYHNRVDSFVDGSDTLEIPVGDKIFKYGLDEHKEDIRNALKNPVEALNEIFGVDVQTSKIDEQKFGAAVAALLSYESLGQKLAEFGVEQFNHQVVTQKLTTPAPPQQQLGGSPPERSHIQKVGDAFQQFREERRRAG
jgi:hypothetical protein